VSDELEQLRIEVAPAPNAVGRWTLEHELEAYAAAVGRDALTRQQELARAARECTCGRQETADKEARAEGRRPKRLLGWEHKPGCNSFTAQNPKLAPRISVKEQAARYEEERRVDQLRQALARSRAEEEA
jgi:hypothetical protein